MSTMTTALEKGSDALKRVQGAFAENGVVTKLLEKEWSPGARAAAGALGILLMGTGAGPAIRGAKILSSALCTAGFLCIGRSATNRPLSKFKLFGGLTGNGKPQAENSSIERETDSPLDSGMELREISARGNANGTKGKRVSEASRSTIMPETLPSPTH